MKTNEGCTQTYWDVEKLIHQLCWRTAKRTGLDHERCVSVANVAFLMAWNDYDPSRSQFVTWVYHKVTGALRSFVGREMKYACERACTEALADVQARQPSMIEALLRDLGDDARAVVALVIETPGDIKRAVHAYDPNPKRIRRALWKHLQDAGWSMGRVVESFDEIREALDG